MARTFSAEDEETLGQLHADGVRPRELAAWHSSPNQAIHVKATKKSLALVDSSHAQHRGRLVNGLYQRGMFRSRPRSSLTLSAR